MSRALSATPIALLAFLCALALAASAIGTGLVPEDSVGLWAGAVMAGDGELSIGSIVAAYPSIPFLATTLLELITPAGTPTPALLSAALLALLTGFWFNKLRASGLSLTLAVLATLLLALHPMLLRAAVAGPGEMALAVFLFIFGNALYDLRARTAIPEVMTAGLALLGVAFSHPIGAAMAVVAVPYLAFTVRPVLVAGSAVSIVLTLAFPALFGAVAFSYVSWVFPGDGWRFFASTDGVAAWMAGLGGLTPGGFSGLRTLDAGLMIAAALLLAAPFAAVAIGRVYRRRPLVAPAAVFAAIAVTAAMIAVATGLFGSPVTVTVAAPVLAAIVLLRVPMDADRRPIAVPLLLLGYIGGVLGLALIEPGSSTQLDAALHGRSGDQERRDALALGGATEKRDGVLVDTFNAPAVVLGRGHSSGLLLPSGETFTIAMLFSRIQAPFVAVPDPQSGIGAADRLNKAFPFLYRDGPAGYRLIYHNNTWRLFARMRDDDAHKN
jgi:hypothetical protein